MSTNTARVACIGAATLDTVVRLRTPSSGQLRAIADAGALSGGGPAATAAVTLARQGVSTAFIGQVGDDAAGQFIRAELVAEGIDIVGLRTVAGAASALSAILIDPSSAERVILTYAGSCPPLALVASDRAVLRAADWIHVDQTGWPAIGRLQSTEIVGRVSVDGGNPIEGLDLAMVTLYAPTASSLQAVSGRDELEAGMDWALEQGAQLVVVTRGAQGSAAMSRFDLEAGGAESMLKAFGGRPAESRARAGAIYEPAFDAPVESTLGAGDVFHGALLASLSRGSSVRACLRQANRIAAMSCAGLDGRSAIPRWADLPHDNV